MSITGHHKQTVEDFFAAIEPVKSAYHVTFSYLAIKKDDAFYLVQGALHMRPLAAPPIDSFQSENIRAGRFNLADPKKFVEGILQGRIQTPDGELVFRAGHEGSLGAYFAPFAPPALQSRARMNALFITGEARAPFIQQPNLDWELKACVTPYENLQELVFEYLGGALGGDNVNVEITASNVAAIDAASFVNDEAAHLVVQLAKGLSPEKAAIRFRLISPVGPVERRSVLGSHCEWTDAGDYQLGSIDIDVPRGAILQCFATYDNLAQSFSWVADPAFSPNARYVAYETFDRQLKKIREIGSREDNTRNYARDVESMVAWLLWMLGFSVAHLNVPNVSDAPDLIGMTPGGHIALVECTTGLIRQNDKLAHLQARVQDLRRSLDLSGNSQVRILPVIVTTKKRDDVATELSQAAHHGVLVVAREDIERAYDRAKEHPNADRIFSEGEQAVRSAAAKSNPSQSPG